MLGIKEAERKTRKQLREIPVPDRDEHATNRVSGADAWKAIQHGNFVDTLVQKTNDFELTVAREAWYTSPSGARLWGSIDFNADGFDATPLPPEIVGDFPTFSLAFRRSNDSKYAQIFLSGIRLLGGNVGISFGPLTARKKQYASLDPGIEIEDALNLLTRKTALMSQMIVDLAETKITIEQARNLIMISGEKDFWPWRNTQYVSELYRMLGRKEQMGGMSFLPSSLYGTAWHLFTAFHAVSATLAVPTQFDLLKSLYPMFVEVLGLPERKS